MQNKFPSNPGFWRVSSLVQLWDEYSGGGKCEKLLYLYLLHGGEKDFEKDTLKRFDVGHKVHDLVKEYFAKSPNFVVKHDEYSVKHPVLPLTGTIDHIVEWERFPGEEFIVEIKSVESQYFNNSTWGAKIKPFRKARWQAGIYSEIYQAKPIVVYFNKDTGEMASHLMSKTDYINDVNEILQLCENVYNATQREKEILPVLSGICKNKPKESCQFKEFCDVGKICKSKV